MIALLLSFPVHVFHGVVFDVMYGKVIFLLYTMYRQNRQPENRPQDFWHRHQDNGLGLQDIRRGQEYHDYQDIRKASHGIYSKKYIDKFAHLQNNQRSNNVDYTKEHMIPKN